MNRLHAQKSIGVSDVYAGHSCSAGTKGQDVTKKATVEGLEPLKLRCEDARGVKCLGVILDPILTWKLRLDKLMELKLEYIAPTMCKKDL